MLLVGVFFSQHTTACEYLLASREQVYVNPTLHELAPSILENLYANST